MANSMSLLNLNQSELNTLKEKTQSILEELQMNCDSDYEDYLQALDQLTAIDGWAESQSTDGGYAEGHDRYASQEEYVEEMKMYLDDSEAKVFFYKSMMFLIFETDYVDRIQRNILDSEYVDRIGQKYNLCELDHLIKDEDRLTQAFKNYLSTVPKLNPSVWELREILAWFKHCWSNELEKAIRMTLCGEYNTVHYSYLVNDYTKQLTYLERIEEVVTLGMLDVYQIVEECCFDFGWPESNLQRKKLLNRELGYMLNHDFGKDVGIDFKKLRYEKAQAELAAHEVSASEFWSLFLSGS
jgi:hypothetical protein